MLSLRVFAVWEKNKTLLPFLVMILSVSYRFKVIEFPRRRPHACQAEAIVSIYFEIRSIKKVGSKGLFSPSELGLRLRLIDNIIALTSSAEL